MSENNNNQQLNIENNNQNLTGHSDTELTEQVKKAGNTLKDMLSLSSGITFLVSKAKDAVSELKDVDTILTQISITNEKLSQADLERIGNNAFDIAEKYGRTSTDYLQAVQNALSSGYKEPEGIAELSLALQTSSGISSELAEQYIAAANQAYSLGGSVEKLNEIFDGFTAIAAGSSLSMNELASSMLSAASQTENLGIGINESTAMISAMTQTTERSAPEMAEAFKNILLNIRQITDEDAGINASGLAEYENACKSLNVSLKETRNGITYLREPMAVINELARAYSGLDTGDTRRNALLDSVGGGINAEALNAMLENYDIYEKTLAQYNNSAGTMAEKAEAVSHSWEGSLTRLSDTWTETIGSIAQSDGVISLIDALNNLLSVINNVTGSLGAIGTISLGAGLLAGFKNTGKRRMSIRISKPVSVNCFEYALHA